MTGTSIIKFSADKEPEVLFVETINSAKLSNQHPTVTWLHGNRFARIICTGLQVKRLLELWNPDYVACESPFLGRFPASFAALTEVIAELKRITFNHDPSLPFFTYTPTLVKATVGVVGKDKTDMSKAIARLDLGYPDQLLSKDVDEHAIDSIAVGLCFIMEEFDFYKKHHFAKEQMAKIYKKKRKKRRRRKRKKRT